jgi:hypothetical protein
VAVPLRSRTWSNGTRHPAHAETFIRAHDRSDEVLVALHEQVLDLKSQSIGMGQLLATFERMGLTQTAGEVRRLIAPED